MDSEQFLMNRFVLSGSEDLGRLQFTVQRLCNFRIDLAGSWMSATSFGAIDAEGNALEISDSSDKGVTAGARQARFEQGSNPLLVSNNAVAFVFYDAFYSRLVTLPVQLRPGGVTLVRP